MRKVTQILIGDPDLTNFVSTIGGVNIIDCMAEMPKIQETLGEVGVCTLMIQSGSPLSNAYDSLLKRRKVVRLSYDNGVIRDFRIDQRTRNYRGGENTQVQCNDIWIDLDDKRVRTSLADGRSFFNIPFYSESVQSILSLIFSSDYNVPDNFSLGTVHANLQNEIISVQSNNLSHLQLINEICKQAEAEWYISWEATEYKVNFVPAGNVGGGSFQADDRPIGMRGGYGNRKSLKKVSQNQSFFSRIVATGGSDNDSFSIQEATWVVESSSYDSGANETTITLKQNCIVKDGYPNLPYFGGVAIDQVGAVTVEGSTFYPVVSTSKPNQIVVTGDATSLVEGYFALNASGDKSSHIDDIDAINDLGLVELDYRRTDVTPYNNLIETYGITPNMAEFDTGVPKGTEKIGSPTVSQIEDRDLVQYGIKGANIQGDTGEGLSTVDMNLHPSTDQPYFSFWISIRAVSGAFKIELVDSEGTVHPKTETVGSDSTVTRGYEVSGIEPASGNAKIKIIFTEDASEIILDAWTFSNSSSSYQFTNLMGARALFIEASKYLKENSGSENDLYDVEFIDPVIENASNKEVEIGSYVHIYDEYSGGSHNLDFTARVVQLSYQETNQGAIVKKARLSKKGDTLNSYFGRNFVSKNEAQNKPTIENKKIQELTGVVDVKEGLKLVSDSDSFGTLTETIDGTVSSIKVNLRSQVFTGLPINIDVAGRTQPIQVTVGKEDTFNGETQYFNAGRHTLPIQEQKIKAPNGSVLYMDGTTLLSMLNITPNQIVQSVEKEKEGDTIGTVNSDLSGSRTSIPLTNIDEEITFNDQDEIFLWNKKGEKEKVIVNGNQTLSVGSDTLGIESVTLQNEYLKGNSWLKEPSWKQSAQIKVMSNQLLLKIDNEGRVASVSLTSDHDGSSVKIRGDQVDINGVNINHKGTIYSENYDGEFEDNAIKITDVGENGFALDKNGVAVFSHVIIRGSSSVVTDGAVLKTVSVRDRITLGVDGEIVNLNETYIIDEVGISLYGNNGWISGGGVRFYNQNTVINPDNVEGHLLTYLDNTNGAGELANLSDSEGRFELATRNVMFLFLYGNKGIGLETQYDYDIVMWPKGTGNYILKNMPTSDPSETDAIFTKDYSNLSTGDKVLVQS